MSELEARFVKRGLWTNLEKGPVMGKTITTDTRTGAFTVALLAMLSSLAATHLWHLVTFLIHQIRANGTLTDGLTKQQQILLRTFPTAASTVTDSLKLGWSWRTQVNRPWMRTCYLALVALLFTTLAAAASILSSYIVSTSNLEVLVSSPYCRRTRFLEGNASSVVQSRPFGQAITTAAEAYSSACYSNDSSNSAACTSLSRPKIEFSTQSVPCPFQSSLCIKGQPFLSFESGLLSVADTFGLNIPRTDDIKYHKKTVCGILPLEGYSSVQNMSTFPSTILGRPIFPDEQVFYLQYGRMVGGAPENVTFYNSLLSSNLTRDFTTGYKEYYTSPDCSKLNNFNPIPDLKPKDADLMMRSIGFNGVQFLEEVDDPMFSAHKPVPRATNFGGAPITLYATDSPMKAVACNQQHEFCFSTQKGQTCTGLKAIPGLPSQHLFPGASDLQLLLLRILIEYAFIFDLSGIRKLYTSTLNSNGQIISAPSNQWITELTYWESQVYASLQIAMPSYAIGAQTYDPAADAYTDPPETPAEKALCAMQKMRKTGGLANINVFGLAFIATFTVVVVLLDLTILRFLVFLSRFKRHLAPRIDRWVQDGIYQLQRRAYEAQGEGSWTRLDKEIPTTSGKSRLPDLPLETIPYLPRQDEKAKDQLESDVFGTIVSTEDGSSPGGENSGISKDEYDDQICHDNHNPALRSMA